MPMSEVILVVDDDKRVLQTFARNLSLAGHEVLTALDGAQALELYAQASPDIMLVDVRMPFIDGFEVLEKVRARDPEAEVILVTGHGDMDMAISALRAGASDFISKPVEQSTLETALRHAQARLRLKRELREARDALRASEAHYRAITETAFVGVGIMGPKADISFVNQAFADMLGYTRDQLTCMNFFADLVHSDTPDGFTDGLRHRWAEGEDQYETQLRRKDASLIYVLVSAALLEASEDTEPRTLVVLTDITERKLAEQALQRANDELEMRVEQRTAELSEANQRLLAEIQERVRLQQKLDAIYRLGQELTLLYDESAIVRRVLETSSQVIQFSVMGCGFVDASQQQLRYRYCLRDGAVEEMDISLSLMAPESIGVAVVQSRQALYIPDTQLDPRYAALDDEIRSRSELCVPMNVLDRIIGVLNIESDEAHRFTEQDRQLLQTLAGQAAVALENARLYTQTQRNARELAALNQAMQAMASNLDLNTVLQQTMEQVNTLLESEDASVLLYDAEADILVFAAVASAPMADVLSGKQLPADTGIAGWVVSHRQSALVNDVQSDTRFYEYIDAATGMTTRSLLAVPLIVKEQVIGVVEVVNKQQGAFTAHDLELLEALSGYAAIAIDNAWLYEDLQDQMRTVQETQMQLRHSEKIAALGRLVASISHEINNPLQSIQGCLTLADEELKAERRQQKLERYLSIAEDEIDRIAAIVRRVRDFYRPSSREEMSPTNLHEVLQSVLELAGKQLQHSGVTVDRAWAENLPSVPANPDHLKQVFLNLVLNAIDAMPDGGTLHILTDFDVEGVNIEFTDTGVGMSEETQARLFEPFFTTKPHGSGLGLSISYGIIEAHQGQISCASRLGIGTTFTITLPVA